MATYELTFILQPNLDEDGLAQAVQKVADIVTAAGGTVNATEPWGKRRLAYPIRHFEEGYYVLQRVDLPAKGPREVDRAIKLVEDVIRHLIVRVEE
ncbi:MAG: 30S ribosomal protein S6 [Chloroflexi bacterium]|nr:30S ribosomal protein S6 [Chloroflexota bacterium]